LISSIFQPCKTSFVEVSHESLSLSCTNWLTPISFLLYKPSQAFLFLISSSNQSCKKEKDPVLRERPKERRREKGSEKEREGPRERERETGRQR
jgi:hypothetical protein